MDLAPSHSSPEINPHTVPRESFDAQIRFAQKWSTITRQDFAEILFSKTTLYHMLLGGRSLPESMPEDWQMLLTGIDQHTDPAIATDYLYGRYTERPDSLYTPPAGASAFSYDYYADRRVIKVHFTNPVRGEHPFSEANMPRRREEFRSILEEVRKAHPEAAMVISGTWLRSRAVYRSFSPSDSDEPLDLMSPGMQLTGDSVWGQFFDASGNTNRRAYDAFVAAVDKATTLDELMQAFPYKTLLAIDSVYKYYDHYGIGTPDD